MSFIPLGNLHPDTSRRMNMYHVASQCLHREMGEAISRYDRVYDDAVLRAVTVIVEGAHSGDSTPSRPNLGNIVAILRAGSILSRLGKASIITDTLLMECTELIHQHIVSGGDATVDPLAHFANAGTRDRHDKATGAARLVHAFMRGDMLQRSSNHTVDGAAFPPRIWEDWTAVSRDGSDETNLLAEVTDGVPPQAEASKAAPADIPEPIRRRMGGLPS